MAYFFRYNYYESEADYNEIEKVLNNALSIDTWHAFSGTIIMKKKRVLKTIGRYYKRLDKKSRQMPPAYDPEIIHKFRTNYKKLKAFLHMIQLPGIPGKLKDFYHQLGTLRDLQLQEQYIKHDARHLPTYRKIIHKQAEQCKDQLHHSLAKKPVQKAGKKTLKAVKTGFSHKTYQKYLAGKTIAMQQMLHPTSFSDNDLHTIRKTFKELSNNNQLHCSTLQDRLGDYQDKCNALRLLRKYRPAELSDKEAQYLQHKEEILVNEKKRMKAWLARALKTIS